MNEHDMGRDEIHIISRHSNWTEGGIHNAFRDTHVYAGKTTWQKFLNYFLIGLGTSFIVAGILFFFAFNWADLHKFVKLGLIEGLIIAAVAIAFLHKTLDERIRNIILSGTSMLVGVLFAVFGQIYQTGADAYDFFLGWTIAIALWAIVSGFPVLWFIFILLCNTTLCLYYEQMVVYPEPYQLCNLLFLINLLFLVLIETITNKGWIKEQTKWLTGILVVTVIVAITFSICVGIIDERNSSWMLSLVLGLVGFIVGIFYGLKKKNLLYPAIIPFAILIILLTLIIKPLHDPVGIFFVISIFIAGFTTLLIMQLVKLSKRWQQQIKEHE